MLRSFSSSASASERALSTALYGRIDSAASSTLGKAQKPQLTV